MLAEKKKSLEKVYFFLGCLNLQPKFMKNKIIIMYKKVLATISYFLSEIIKLE
jgi:hypothetical protein